MRTRRRSLAVAFAAASTLLVPTSALAGPGPSAAPQAGPDRHCVGRSAEVGKRADNTRVTCYDSFRKAIHAASGGLIADAPESAKAAATDAKFTARVNGLAAAKKRAGSAGAAAQIIHSIEYVHHNHGGSTFTWWNDWACDREPDNDFWHPNIAEKHPQWDNQISSFKTYADCEVNHYEHPNWGGVRTGHQTTQSYIGDAMNDRSTEFEWA
ncbi:hypothetical protein [Spirillospora sp. CA-294931]|uniref:hypothetical protein n=1 Tax=Spirillospora sp. CA-294931 TaxID=3240042 RepID=UPI003D91C9E9